MLFEWNEDKNRSNIARHRVSFETASLVFDDQHALSLPERIVEGGERWQTLGMIDGVVLNVAHTWADEGDDEVIRLISARKATPKERRAYAQNR